MSQGNILCSWSGGKDSCFALMKAIERGFQPKMLLNVLNEQGEISRSHGIPAHLLRAQAEASALPIHLINSSWKEYETKFLAALKELKKEFDLSAAVFGDIDLQPHRDWEEKVCEAAGLQAVLPLWQQDRSALVKEMLDWGIETIIVSCNDIMGEGYLGLRITTSLVEELERQGIDACGENGEFHTLVINCPMFRKPVDYKMVKKVKRDQYWFAILE